MAIDGQIYYRPEMATDYDKLFAETPNALGEPTPIFVDFFRQYDGPLARVLDIGCGQGRDALFIARAGHHVLGVDLSTNGVRALLEIARKEDLPIEGIVADITDFVPDGDFDIILIDRTLHMLTETARLTVLERLLDHVTALGWVLIADENRNIEGFKAVIAGHRYRWKCEYAKRGYLFIQRQ